jgi:hypothetical protein
MLIWLAVSPIPAAITTEANAVVRATAMLPLPMILTSAGLVAAVKWVKDKAKLGSSLPLYAIYLVVLGLFAGSYLKAYFTDYPRDYSWSWQYGYKQAIQYTKENYSKYDKIIISKKYGEPHEFFLFYWPWSPRDYQNDINLKRYYQSGWYWVDSFDKFYFVNDWQINTVGTENKEFVLESGGRVGCELPIDCLLITSPDNYPKEWRKLATIYFLDGKVAFEILDNQIEYLAQ